MFRVRRLRFDALQHITTTATTATHCNTLHHTTRHCNTLLHNATHCNNIRGTHHIAHLSILRPCNTLQRIATHCNTMQDTAPCNDLVAFLSILRCCAGKRIKAQMLWLRCCARLRCCAEKRIKEKRIKEKRIKAQPLGHVTAIS